MWRYGILGSVELREGERRLPLRGPGQVSLLALLLIEHNRAVSADCLIEALWPDGGAAGARERLRMAIARLRRALDAAGGPSESSLRTVAAGYMLAVTTGERDADVFETRLAEGRRALDGEEPERAAELLSEALALWRGPALADVAHREFAQAEIRRLEELRLVALEARVEADLELGHHTAVVAELEALSVAHPARERLSGQLMLALYRCGRQREALDVYQRTRRHLAEELGLEPGPALQATQAQILRQQADLEPPARRSVPTHRDAGRVPAPPNRTVGREPQLRAIVERLRCESVRLLTLTGPGGVGKTRLAVEAARAVDSHFADGPRFVSLASLHRHEDVALTIASTLRVEVLAGESPEQAIERFLQSKHLLLVVDNCEHVLDGALLVGDIVAACPRVSVLATSREPLGLRAEQRFLVPPLPLPDDGNAATRANAGAVTLFVERARSLDPDFALGEGNRAAVAEICRRVDGLPLGIELAAARCGLLSPAEIAQRLDAALGAPGTGARDVPSRQRTLRATIDWSHALLDAHEQACFARFAVFAGSATVDAAQIITGANLDTLERLVAKNLLVRRGQENGPTRLSMLETVRAYATERFAAPSDRAAVHQRHLDHYLALAERHGSEPALLGLDGRAALARLDADIENIHAALHWAVRTASARSARRLCATLGWYWSMRSRASDAVEWSDRALSLPGDADPALRARVLCVKAKALWPLRRTGERQSLMVEAEALARAVADPTLLAHVLGHRAQMENQSGRPTLGERFATEAMHFATAAGDEWVIATAACAKAQAAASPNELRRRVDLATSLLEKVGNVYQLAQLLSSASYLALKLESDNDARQYVSRALPLTQELDSPYLRILLYGNAGLAALLTGDTRAARDAFREELRACREMAAPHFAAEGLAGLAATAAVSDDLSRAARLYGAAAGRFDEGEAQLHRRLRGTFFEPARRRHGSGSWDAAAREGAAMTVEDAIAYALEEGHRPDPESKARTSARARS